MTDRLLSRRHRLVVSAVAACSALGLSACGLQSAGNAAEVGDTVIPMSDVQSAVDDFATESGQGSLTGPVGREVTTALVNQHVEFAMYEELAQELDISTSEAEIMELVEPARRSMAELPEEQYQGSVQQNFEQSGVVLTRSNLEEVARGQLLRTQVFEELGEDANPVQALDQHGIEITLNPRFGSWDPQTGVDPSGGNLVDLAGTEGDEDGATDSVPPVNP